MTGQPEQELDENESGPKPVRSEELGEIRQPREVGGPKGLEPTRYGDWERAGRCIDF